MCLRCFQVRRLVEEGCLAPSVTDGSGRTPLAVAEHARHGPLVEYLRWASSYVSTSTQGPYAQLGEAAKARFGALPDLTVAAAAAAGEEKDKDGVAKGALAAGRGTRGSSTSGRLCGGFSAVGQSPQNQHVRSMLCTLRWPGPGAARPQHAV